MKPISGMSKSAEVRIQAHETGIAGTGILIGSGLIKGRVSVNFAAGEKTGKVAEAKSIA